MEEMFGNKRDRFYFSPKGREICLEAEFEKQQDWSVMIPHTISPGHLDQKLVSPFRKKMEERAEFNLVDFYLFIFFMNRIWLHF